MAEVKTIDELYQDLINKKTTSQPSIGLGSAIALSSKQGKLDFKEISPFKRTDVFKTLNDGSEVALYDNYIAGTDNNERFAQSQDTWDKWSNGLTKAGANLVTTVAGNTVGLVYGGINLIAEGSFNSVFDNDFSNALADWNEKLGYQLPNYYTEQEKNEGFLGSLDNANFWANDVMGGLSFTLGTVISEAIWAATTGGTANVAKAGLKGAQASRWGLGVTNSAKGIAKYKEFVNGGIRTLFTKSGSVADDALKNVDNFVTTGYDDVLKGATSAATKSKWKNTARFLATTSGNEAGIEALHFKRESRENFYDNFEKLNGREPSQEEITEFENNVENGANAVFATNMAVLMPSNAVMFGSMFNIGKPFKGLTKSVDKTLFGIGVEKTAEGVYKGVEASTAQRIGRIAYAGLKPIVTEGLWEEGLQGTASKSAENWIASTYDSKYNNETISLADATYQAMGEQYGTKEGWKEIGIGGIIGGGMSLVSGKGKFQEVREFNEKQKYQDEYVAKGLNQFGDNTATATELVTKKMMLNARIKSASEKQVEAVKKGDDVGAMLAQQEPLIAEIQFRKSIGENPKELIAKYKTALDILPQEAWDEAGIENIEEYKTTVLNGYKNIIDSHERASKFADAVLGETTILGQNTPTQQLKDALTYSIVSGETANKAMNTSLQDMAKIIGEDTIKAQSIQDNLSRMGKNKQVQVNNLNKTITQADLEITKLSEELQRLQVSKDETKGERLQKVQAKLISATEKSAQLKQDREELAKEVSQESKRRRAVSGINMDEVSLTSDFISGDDLANIDTKLAKIESSIKDYEGINHEVYYDLLESQKQYKSAKVKFLGYQNSIDAIVTGKFQPKFAKMEGLLGKVFNSKQPLDNFTEEFLKETYDNYLNSVGKAGVDVATESQFITDEVFNIFKETGEVSEEVKISIAERVKNKEVLSEREKEIYNTLTKEINQLTAPNPNKPDLTNQPILVEEENLTDAQKLRKEIEKAFEKDYPLLTTDVDELIEEKPTKEEIERYLDLYAKKDKFDLFEQKEFEQLQPRMSKWFMAQSLPVAGSTIADLAEIISQLETQIDKEETLTEVEASDLLPFEEEEARAINRVDVLQNIAGSAVAKIKDGKIFFVHVNTKNILDKLIQNGAVINEVQTVTKDGKLNKPKDLTLELINKNANVKGTIFTIGEVKVTIGDRGNVVMTLEDYNKAKDVINLHYYDSRTGSWSYADLYEENLDGSKRKKESEYVTNTNSDNIYNVEQGDYLEAFVDMTTQWNQGLIDEAYQEDVISEELKTKIRNTLEITTRKDRENNSTLKSTSQESVDDNFMLIRKRFADEFIDKIESEGIATLPKKLELNIEIPISEMYLGTPEFVLDGSNTPIDFNITERGTEEVITQGYVQGSEIVLANKKIENVSRLFVSNIAKANPNIKIPVVVLKKGKHQFAFPITLNKTVENQVDKLTTIENKNLAPVDEIKEINNLLISLGSPTRVSGLSDIKLEDIRQELEGYTTHITADELADANYDKINLTTDATIKIDLEDKLITSPKITVDYQKAIIGTKEDNEVDAVKLRGEIVKDIVAIRNIVNSTPNISEKSRFTQAFDENDVENKGTDIMNRKDIKFIRKVFFNENGRLALQGATVDTIGREKLLKLREKLELLQFYEDQIKTSVDKETTKKLNCNG